MAFADGNGPPVVPYGRTKFAVIKPQKRAPRAPQRRTFMGYTYYRVDREVREVPPDSDGYAVAFQEVTSHYDEKVVPNEYRFMWVTPDGKMLSLRGGAVVNDPGIFLRLIGKAHAEGWFSSK
jgi:hypothetical protein